MALGPLGAAIGAGIGALIGIAVAYFLSFKVHHIRVNNDDNGNIRFDIELRG